MNLQITEVNEDDLENILALQRRCYQSEALLYNNLNIPPLQQNLNQLTTEFIQSTVILKIVIESQIVGSVRAFSENGSCFIGRLIVDPDFQNRGIGYALMNAIEDCFKDCDRYELFTGHRSEKNLYLYRKLGYRIFKEQKIDDGLILVFLEKKVSKSQK